MKKLSVLTAALLVASSSVAFAASELSTAGGTPVTTQGNVVVGTSAGSAEAVAEKPAKPAKAHKGKKAKGKKAKAKKAEEAAH